MRGETPVDVGGAHVQGAPEQTSPVPRSMPNTTHSMRYIIILVYLAIIISLL